MQRQHIKIGHNIWDSQYKIWLTMHRQDNGLLSVAATQLLPLPQSPASVQPGKPCSCRSHLLSSVALSSWGEVGGFSCYSDRLLFAPLSGSISLQDRGFESVFVGGEDDGTLDSVRTHVRPAAAHAVAIRRHLTGLLPTLSILSLIPELVGSVPVVGVPIADQTSPSWGSRGLLPLRLCGKAHGTTAATWEEAWRCGYNWSLGHQIWIYGEQVLIWEYLAVDLWSSVESWSS